ncbi:MAG: TonB family protein [Calditrichaceae bacterium]|nr:TonB family protein [Calditrichia bacterium]NUQ39812.1 TonB family protein [Calditrichaceae bacterium]
MSAKMSGSPAAPGFRLAGFPKEFERSLWETLDRRYYSVLLSTFLLLYGFTFYMAHQDWSLSEDQINRIKERAIKKIYNVELIVPEPAAGETGAGSGGFAEEEPSTEVSEKGKERVEESQAQRAQRRQRGQAGLEARSRQLQQEVGGQGILAIATAAGGTGAGNVAYSDVLRDLAEGGGGVGDIGDVVEGTVGIGVASGSGDRTRAAKGSGYRQDGSGTGIDDLISGSGSGSISGGGSFERRGEVKLTSENVKLTAGAGSRDPESITASINQQASSIEYCYQKRAKINPNLKGRIDLEIEIAPDGTVPRANVINSTLGDDQLDTCILRAVKRWRFGAVDTGIVRIRVPFIF